jgi:tetratricopeptide (TPR) repeat protein
LNAAPAHHTLLSLKPDPKSTQARASSAGLPNAPRTPQDGNSRDRRKVWAFRIAALLIPFLLLCAVEAGFRLLGYGHPSGFFLNSKAEDRAVWIENYQFGWRFFPPRLARVPQPILIPAEKAPRTCRIFVFGESAAMGDPEPAFGLSRMIEAQLSAIFPELQFEVVNVGMTAISSSVIREIARDCRRREGDFWIIYMGNNEVVGPFGAGTVFGPQAPRLGLIRANAALTRLRAGQWLAGIQSRNSDALPASWEGMEMFLEQQVRHDDPRLETVYSTFAWNLEDLLEFGTRSGAGVILSTVASNLRDCAPFASRHGTGIDPESLSRFQQLYRAGMEAQDASRFEHALDLYRQALEIDADFAELHFRLARCQKALGAASSALQHYQLARDLDTLRFRADGRINQIIRDRAEDWSGHEVEFVDAESVFAADGPPGERLFFDHVHLTFEGNDRLARVLVESLVPQLQRKFGVEAGAGLLSIAAVAARLGLTDWHRLQVYTDMQRRLELPPFSAQANARERMERIREMVQDLNEAIARDGLQTQIAAAREAAERAPRDWMLRETLAKLLQASGDHSAALQQWSEIQRRLPHYVPAWYNAGNLLDQQGRGKEAIPYFERALALQPQTVEALNGLGLALSHLGHQTQAIDRFRQAIDLRPEFVEARVNLGLTLAQLGRIEDAVAQYRTALQINSNSVAAHLNLGRLLASRGEHHAAMAHYEQALLIQPQNAIAHYNLANALVAQKSPRAAEHYESAIRANPEFAEAHVGLGLERAREGKDEEALAHFAQAVKLQPQSLDARMNQAIALAKLRRFDEASDEFKQVLKLEPKSVEAHLNLGIALARQNRFDEAIGYFEKTLQLDPGNQSARNYLGMARRMKGD